MDILRRNDTAWNMLLLWLQESLNTVKDDLIRCEDTVHICRLQTEARVLNLILKELTIKH